MTSYEFEVAAKNAVIEALKDVGIEMTIHRLNLVWFTHVIGNKKCVIWGEGMGKFYAEVTWSLDSSMMYVDMYRKELHKEIHGYELDFKVH